MSRLRTYLVLILLTLINFTYAQRGLSLPFSSFYDENAWLSMGLQYNYVNSSYKVGLKDNWASMGIRDVPVNNVRYIDEFTSIQSIVSHGMSVALPIEVRFTDNLSSSFQPTFTFINSTGVNFKGPDAGGVEKELIRKMRHVGTGGIEGANYNAFEFPINIRFRSDEKILKNKFNRYRGYVTGGARYIRWANIVGEYNEYKTMIANGTFSNPQMLVMKPGYFAWEAGMGVEIFFPYFRMSPEIKLIQSFGDVLDRKHILSQNNPFMTPLDKTFIRNIQFSLIFQ